MTGSGRVARRAHCGEELSNLVPASPPQYQSQSILSRTASPGFPLVLDSKFIFALIELSNLETLL
jgi:hypothetical protein